MEVANIPDITYWNIARPYITDLVDLKYQGQSGALQMGCAYAFASVLKQDRSGHSTGDADWTLAPGTRLPPSAKAPLVSS